MDFLFDGRPSESPLVEAIWRTQSSGGGSFTSVAASNWEMVITRQFDKTRLTVRGPETKAKPAPIPEDAEFFGIIFKLGTFMPHLPVTDLVDEEIDLPIGAGRSFWLHGSTWQFPTYDNADTFINRLVHDGLLVREPIVEDVLKGQIPDFSLRSVQRKFLRATGLTRNAVYQIERARQALALLQQGVSILDTVEQVGYFDQSHLTNSLRRLVGQTPAQIARRDAVR